MKRGDAWAVTRRRSLDTKARIGLGIIALVVILFAIFLWYFLPIESCLDLGGRWDYAQGLCENSQYPAEF